MTLDECLSALRASDDPPPALMNAAVAHVAALAPLVTNRIERFCRGIHLLPPDARVLSYGLVAMVAARHPGTLDQLLVLARQPDNDLAWLFDERAEILLARAILTVWDRPVADLLHVIEHADLEVCGRWALLDVLTRLCLDGSLPRQDAADFLGRLSRDNLFDDDSVVWWGWASAVEKLALAELVPEVERLRRRAMFGNEDEREVARLLEVLRSAAQPTAAQVIADNDCLQPIDDPAEAFAWIARRKAAFAALDEKSGGARKRSPPDDDVARGKRLTPEEHNWLSTFLVSRQVPDTTMNFETLDGFMTALVIGPTTFAPSQWLPEIWGVEDTTTPIFENPEQGGYGLGLLMKHWNAIVERKVVDALHRPAIEMFGVPRQGEDWAQGFLEGVELAGDLWKPFLEDSRAELAAALIFALAGELDEDEPSLTREGRRHLLATLPETVRTIARFWRDPATAFPEQRPARSQKVGRNDPCPCGSGKKFKKCCGSGGGQTVH